MLPRRAPESDEIMGAIRIVTITVRGTQHLRIIAAPRSAPQHASGSSSRAGRVTIRPCLIIVLVIPVGAPLEHIARHVQHAIRAGPLGIASHRSGALLVLADRTATARRIPGLTPGIVSALRSPRGLLPLGLRR